MFFGVVIFISGVISLIMVRKHFLMSLLGLEFLMLSIFMYSFFFFGFYFYDYYFIVIFLVLGVCDGVLGLSLLVYLIRSVGNDYLDNLILC
uniref:NADH-ubiquinone oxidoreductase chain 4L n=1 Tax=Paracatonidia sp. SX-2018 TaxID=2507540 RepID=A0A565D7D1_9HEMI|nr:NADH dehydrogenase subunit 4L [Paracatonidia sp. SX-2018]